MGNDISHATQECFVMQREEMELLAVRATLWRMEIELLREIHRYLSPNVVAASGLMWN
jgi:hypothetical protein